MQPSLPIGPVPGAPSQPVAPYPYNLPSSAPSTLGTLSIVFGAFVIFSCVLTIAFSGGMASLMRELPGQAEAAAAMETYLREIRVPSLIQAGVLAAMSGWLISIGVGQRRYRAWAVRQSVRWGIIALVIVVGDLIMSATLMLPAAQRMVEATQATAMANPFGSVSSVIGLVFQVAIHAPYPIILIVAFRKPSVIAAMAR
jgi:hypothetical protein